MLDRWIYLNVSCVWQVGQGVVMQPDRFTLKAQEAIQNTQEIATEYNHQYIDCEHLLLALLRQEDQLFE